MTGEIFIQGETRGEESKGRPILFKSRAADKKAIERLTSLCTAGPSVASEKKVAESETNAEGKGGEKKGGRICGPSTLRAVMWGLF